MKEKFLIEIKEAVNEALNTKLFLLERTLQLHKDNENQFITNETAKLNDSLNNNFYSTWLPFEGIKTNIDNCLTSYFYDNTIYPKCKGIVLDEMANRATINIKDKCLHVKPYFGIFTFDMIEKPLVEYITIILLIIELEKRIS